MLDLLEPAKTGLLLIDFQEKLFPLIERAEDILHGVCKLAKGASYFNIPVLVTEQARLGDILCPIKELKTEDSFSKSSFSCLGEKKIEEKIVSMDIDNWVLCGIEAHICVLQTAKALLKMGKRVIIPNDTIGSRSIFDFSTSIAELRDIGARISSTEIILFEWVKDSKAAEFKDLLSIIKEDPYPVA
jgi:nicotinamidase-related amidase